MDDNQVFGVVASLALLVWLLGRGILRDSRQRRYAEMAAYGLVGAALLYAVVMSLAHFLG